MALREACFLAILVAAATASQAAVGSPVEKVVQLLEDLKTRIEGDGTEEQQIYDKYACWCEKTTKRKAGEILEGQGLMRTLGSEILRLKALIAQRTQEIADTIEHIEKEQEAVKEMTSIREQENSEYMAKSTEIGQALAALEKAIIVLHKATSETEKTETSLAQDATASFAAFRSAATKLSAAIALMPPSAPKLSAAKAKQVEAFLDGASTAGYAPQSATVQGILKDMYDTMSGDLEDMTKDEAKKNADFEAVLATKLALLHEYKGGLEKKYAEKAEAETQLAESQQAYDDTEKELNADIEFFDQAKVQCEAKYEEWQIRKGDREMELEGIEEALKILTSDEARETFGKAIKPGMETSFLQLNSVDSESAPAAKAYRVLQAQAKKTKSLRLAALAATVRTATGGHFDEVIKAIDEMIAILKEEEADDIKKRDECKNEFHKIASTVADLEWKIEKHVAQIDKLEKLIKEREDEKVKTIEQIETVKQEIVEMEDQRKTENEAFKTAKTDDLAAIDLLEQAKEALGKYYAENKIEMGPVQGSVKGAFAQQGPEFEVHEDQAPDATFSHKGHRKTESKGIISILTMIIEDLHAEIKNGMASEEKMQLEFEKSLEAAKKLQADLEQKVENLTEIIASRNDELNTEKEVMKTTEEDLEQEKAYEKEIKPDCDVYTDAARFKDRSTKRKAEMEGLVTAKEYLAGAAPPAATLVQKSHLRKH